jgi:hypothetical protein
MSALNRKANEEATKFIDAHGYREILDETVTNIPCLLLVDDNQIYTHDGFRRVIDEKIGYRKTDTNIEKVVDRGEYKEYFINRLTQIEKVYEQLDRIYDANNNAFKILVDFGFIVMRNVEDKVKFSVSPPDSESANLSIPHTITNKSDLDSYKHYIASNISEKMEKHHADSRTRYVGIVTSMFKVIPLGSGTGAKIDIPGYEWITKNDYIFSCDQNNNLCMFYALAIAQNGFTSRRPNGKTYTPNMINAAARKLYINLSTN